MMRHRIVLVSILGVGASIGACVGDSSVPDAGGGDATVEGGGNDTGTKDTGPVDSGACEAGQSLCGQACVSLGTDPNNCGTCNHKCASGDAGQYACTNGKCGDSIVDVAIGQNHACVALLDGSVWCWGINYRGEMGVPLATQTSTTPLAAQIGNVARVAASENDTSCAVKKDNTVWCWGYNPGGMLGHAPGGGSPADYTPGNGQYYNAVPQQVGGLVPSDEVILEQSGAVCARALTGGVTCWGIMTCGVLGVPDAGTSTSALPTTVAGVSGAAHLAQPHAWSGECVVGDAGGLVCWGQNTSGEVGHAPEATPPFCSFGIAGSVSAPSNVAGISNVTTVTNSDLESTCATTTGGQLYCWGYQNGLLTDSGAPYATPALVTTGTTAKATKVVSGSGHMCALFDDATVRCWGSNTSGQIGNGSISAGFATPTKANVSNAVDVFAGGNVTAALLSDGSLAIWGDNGGGVLAHTPGTANDVTCGNNGHCNPTPSIVSGIP